MSYVTGNVIRELREKKSMTQKELAEKISVSDKTVSKWETGKGLPDIGILDDLAKALGISITDLFTGEYRENDNPSANMRKVHFYVCPICGNIVSSVGPGSFSCCGVNLYEAEAEDKKEDHAIDVEVVENEYFVRMDHGMTKEHYISFLAYATIDSVEIKKLYPQQDAEVRFQRKGHGIIYAYCNRHGLFRKMV